MRNFVDATVEEVDQAFDWQSQKVITVAASSTILPAAERFLYNY